MDLYEYLLNMEKIPTLWDTDEGKKAIGAMMKEAKKIAKESFIECKKKKLADTIADDIKEFNSGVEDKDKIVFDFIEIKSHDGQFFYDFGEKKNE